MSPHAKTLLLYSVLRTFILTETQLIYGFLALTEKEPSSTALEHLTDCDLRKSRCPMAMPNI
jgi:hypothetical protein